MGTLATVRQDFVKASGRYDLLVNADLATNTDNGANAFINQALRYLDSRVEHPRSKTKVVRNVAAGDFFIGLDRVISIDSLRLINATGECNLTEKQLQLDSFRDNFARPYSAWTNGVPAFWALDNARFLEEIVYGLGQVDAFNIDEANLPEMMRDFSFLIEYTTQDDNTNKLSPWEMPPDGPIGGKSITGSQFVSASVAKPYTQQTIETLLHPYIAGIRYELVIDIASVTVSGTNFVMMLIDGYQAGGTQLTSAGADTSIIQSDDLTGDRVYEAGAGKVCVGIFDKTVSTAFVPGVGDVTLNSFSMKPLYTGKDTGLDSGTLLVDDDAEEERSFILFSTPVDGDYTVEIEGKFYHAPLSADTDKNYWTVRYPQLLANTAALCVEETLHSGERVKYWMNVIQREIFQIEGDTVEGQWGAQEAEYERTV